MPFISLWVGEVIGSVVKLNFLSKEIGVVTGSVVKLNFRSKEVCPLLDTPAVSSMISSKSIAFEVPLLWISLAATDEPTRGLGLLLMMFVTCVVSTAETVVAVRGVFVEFRCTICEGGTLFPTSLLLACTGLVKDSSQTSLPRTILKGSRDDEVDGDEILKGIFFLKLSDVAFLLFIATLVPFVEPRSVIVMCICSTINCRCLFETSLCATTIVTPFPLDDLPITCVPYGRGIRLF
mmetsp:Transcript_40129/g.65235  ORF Transcript_40129/g.65235 Transcript_40129/m.65235 type:complete len:236 (-) Transcript_40129:143-850(-)